MYSCCLYDRWFMYSLPGLPLNVPMYQDVDLALNVQKMGSIRVVMISISGQEIWLKNKSNCMHEVCTLGLAHWGGVCIEIWKFNSWKTLYKPYPTSYVWSVVPQVIFVDAFKCTFTFILADCVDLVMRHAVPKRTRRRREREKKKGEKEIHREKIILKKSVCVCVCVCVGVKSAVAGASVKTFQRT